MLCGRLVKVGRAAAGDANRIVVRHAQRLNGIDRNREIGRPRLPQDDRIPSRVYRDSLP